MSNAISTTALCKFFNKDIKALDSVTLEIKTGEIFSLLGPNGAGKTTLIKIICGLSQPSSGEIRVMGLDLKNDYKKVRSFIGLVPQELHTDMFETVWDTTHFSRGIFGLKKDNNLVSEILKELSIWEKKDEIIANLSGGMKRRVLIAKALAHEPKILFLDEPTAGVDVELRQDMWNLIRSYRKKGVTIILTTHFIDEAEELADRIGIINDGKLVIIDDKINLISKLGEKKIIIHLEKPISKIPKALESLHLDLLSAQKIQHTFTQQNEGPIVTRIIQKLDSLHIQFTKVETVQSSLEEIFVNLVSKKC